MKKIVQGVFLIILIVCAAQWHHASISFESILDELEAFAISQMHSHNVPGMQYSIVYNNEIIYCNSFGVKTFQTDDPVNDQTLFEIGSVSKAFMSALFAKFVDEGLFDWETKIKDIYTDFEMWDPWVTDNFNITDIFSHRSGMRHLSLDAMAVLGFGRNEIINAFRLTSPETSFRASFGYVNNLFVFASKVLEAILLQSWEDIITQEIFLPLGMDHTTVCPDEIDNLTNRASGHIETQSGLFIIPSDWRYKHVIRILSPAGGIHSNAYDMASWMRFILAGGYFNNEQLISEENLSYTFSPRIFSERDQEDNVHSYCLGWAYSDISPYPILYHRGNTTGMHSIIGLIPEIDLGIVVLTNTGSNPLPDNILSMFYQLCFNQKEHLDLQLPVQILDPFAPFRHTSFTVSEEKVCHKSLDSFKGFYRNPAYGNLIVTKPDHSLFLSVGNKGYEIQGPLTFIGNDNFIFVLPDFPGYLLLLNFQRKPGGNARRVMIPGLDDVDNGIFKRIF